MLFYIILCIICENNLLMNVTMKELLLLNSVNNTDDVICEFLTLWLYAMDFLNMALYRV